MNRSGDYDYVLLGGGLQNALIALALLGTGRSPRLALVEQRQQLGGNHTWCCHEGDLTPAGQALVAPLLRHRWPAYLVRFPGRERKLELPYCAITSEALDAVVRDALAAHGADLYTGRRAVPVDPHRVDLEDGTRLRAALVLDGRGPGRPAGQGCGYQKFLGLEVRLSGTAAPALPVVMDATVTQLDGYRFVYVLPLASDRLLVEDTYFSNRPGLDRTVLRRRIHAYLRERGLRAAEVVREEHGVLPMPWLDEPPASDAAVGYRGGWFHPATGYSLPVATQVATTVASAPLAGVTAALRALRRQLEPQLRFARWLNRMMFACEPVHRRDLLARFYRLPDASVTRFYGLRMRWPDRLRLLSGTPPRGVPLGAVLGTRRSPSWS